MNERRRKLLEVIGASVALAAIRDPLESLAKWIDTEGRPERMPGIPWMPETVSQWRPLIKAASRKNGFRDYSIFELIYLLESTGNYCTVGPDGAMGIGQVLPENALLHENLLDPRQNIEASVRVFRWFYDYFVDLRLAVSAYNAGQAYVESGNIPWKTRIYTDYILRMYEQKDLGQSSVFEGWMEKYGKYRVMAAEKFYRSDPRTLGAVKFMTEQLGINYRLFGLEGDLVTSAYLQFGLKIEKYLGRDEEKLAGDSVLILDQGRIEGIGMMIYPPFEFVMQNRAGVVEICSLNPESVLYQKDFAGKTIDFQRFAKNPALKNCLECVPLRNQVGGLSRPAVGGGKNSVLPHQIEFAKKCDFKTLPQGQDYHQFREKSVKMSRVKLCPDLGAKRER